VAKVLGDIGKKSTKDAAEYIKRLKVISRVSSVLGGLALLSIVIAFICLIAFALKNTGSV